MPKNIFTYDQFSLVLPECHTILFLIHYRQDDIATSAKIYFGGRISLIDKQRHQFALFLLKIAFKSSCFCLFYIYSRCGIEMKLFNA